MIIIPDIHGRSFWKEAVAGRESEEILFLGDYVDPYTMVENVEYWDGMKALYQVMEFKMNHMDNVTLLLGNHDLSYITSYLPKCRHDFMNHDTIKQLLKDNLSLFQIAHEKQIAGKHYLFTHAGILPGWLEENAATLGHITPANAVEELNKAFHAGKLYKELGNVSIERGGFYETGSCVWADIDEHIAYANSDEDSDFKQVCQVFGHTYQQTGEPLITPHFACLDCKKAFVINEKGEIQEL